MYYFYYKISIEKTLFITGELKLNPPLENHNSKWLHLTLPYFKLIHTSYRFHNVSQRIKMAHGITVLKLNKTMYSNRLSKDSILTHGLLVCQTAYLFTYTVLLLSSKRRNPLQS